MNNIKIGDKVVAIRAFGSLIKGMVYEVLEYSDIYIKVRMPDGGRRVYKKNNFKPIDVMDELFGNNNVEENVMSKEEKVLSVISKWGEQDYEEKLRHLDWELKSNKRALNDLKDSVKQRYNKEREIMLRINETKTRMNEGKDYSSDIHAILSHDSVDRIDASGDVFTVYTNYITIHDEKGNKFAGNKFRLDFDYKQMECRVYGEDKDYCKTSWWHDRHGGDIKDPHPHVNGRTGEPCWGTAGSMLSYSMNEFELYASYLVVYNFLQQVNTSDPAGLFIRNWKCIDMDGEEIGNPYSAQHECKTCGDPILDEDDMYICDRCGGYLCGDHTVWVESECVNICEDCDEEYYEICERCGERHRRANMAHCVECDHYFCQNCSTTHEDEEYCDSCFENNFGYCEGCGDYVKNEELFTCDECREIFCTNCDTKREHEGQTLCDECYEDALDEEEENEDEN